MSVGVRAWLRGSLDGEGGRIWRIMERRSGMVLNDKKTDQSRLFLMEFLGNFFGYDINSPCLKCHLHKCMCIFFM